MAMYILVGLALLAVIFLFQKQQASGEVYTRFGLRANAYRMLSTDLGKSAGRIKLARFGINGIADAVFEAVSGKEIVVGEFKSRKYRNKVKLHEFYQLMLYMGHLKALHPKHTIRGVLAYADDKVSITYDPDVYEGLVGLKSDYWETVKRRSAGSTAPLHKRIKVNGMNRGIRLSAEM